MLEIALELAPLLMHLVLILLTGLHMGWPNLKQGLLNFHNQAQLDENFLPQEPLSC